MAQSKKLSDEEAQMLAEAEKAAKAGFTQKNKQETVDIKDLEAQQYAKTVEVPHHQEMMNEEIEEPDSDSIPEDPDERLKWTAKMLKQINPKCPVDYNALRQWKGMHGSVFVLNIQDKVYIYRYIKRQEWAQLQASDSFNNMTPVQQEDAIVERCLLWPEMNPINKAAMPAGAPSMLAEQIRIQSMFLDPVQVANITLKL